MQVFIKIKEKDAGLSTEVKVAKMSLIDLAGSEKVRENPPGFGPLLLSHYLGSRHRQQGSKVPGGIQHQQVPARPRKLHQRPGRRSQVHPLQELQADQAAQGLHRW